LDFKCIYDFEKYRLGRSCASPYLGYTLKIKSWAKMLPLEVEFPVDVLHPLD